MMTLTIEMMIGAVRVGTAETSTSIIETALTLTNTAAVMTAAVTAEEIGMTTAVGAIGATAATGAATVDALKIRSR